MLSRSSRLHSCLCLILKWSTSRINAGLQLTCIPGGKQLMMRVSLSRTILPKRPPSRSTQVRTSAIPVKGYNIKVPVVCILHFPVICSGVRNREKMTGCSELHTSNQAQMQDVLEFAEGKSAERLDKQREGDECPPVVVGEMANLHHHKVEGALAAILVPVSTVSACKMLFPFSSFFSQQPAVLYHVCMFAYLSLIPSVLSPSSSPPMPL